MTQAAPHQAASRYEQVCSAEQASSFSAAEIREAIAYWVGRERMDIADALVAAGMSLYPESEDILAIGALLAEINQDWAQAQDCLEQLIALQAERATAESWYHLVRVMRCRQAHYAAFTAVKRGLRQHPTHAGLQVEFAELSGLLDSLPVEIEAQLQAS